MNANLTRVALALTGAASLGFLASCGDGEAIPEPETPTFGETKTTTKGDGGEKGKGEKGDRRERGERPEGDRRRGGFNFADRDTDGDGALNREEMGDMGWLMMGRADENGDGKLTEAEMRAYRESGNFRPPQPAEFVQVLDKDGDGKLTADEYPERMRSRFADADLDGDGKVTTEEMETRRAEREAERALNPDQGRGFGRGPGGGGPGFGRGPGGGGPGFGRPGGDGGGRPGGGRPGGDGGGRPGGSGGGDDIPGATDL